MVLGLLLSGLLLVAPRLLAGGSSGVVALQDAEEVRGLLRLDLSRPGSSASRAESR